MTKQNMGMSLLVLYCLVNTEIFPSTSTAFPYNEEKYSKNEIDGENMNTDKKIYLLGNNEYVDQAFVNTNFKPRSFLDMIINNEQIAPFDYYDEYFSLVSNYNAEDIAKIEKNLADLSSFDMTEAARIPRQMPVMVSRRLN